MRVGMKLRDARKERGMKVEEAAELMGVAVPTVTRWENGSIDIPSSALFKYIEVLGMTPAEFFGDSEEPGVTTRAAHLANGAKELPPEAEKEIEQLIEYIRHKYSKKKD